MDNQNINIEEINKNLQESYIHYDPTRVDYTINDQELKTLEQAGSSIWKDVFLTTLGLGIPLLINGINGYCKLPENTPLTIEIFVNFLFAGICLILAIICFIVWMTNKKSFNKIIKQIKNKPKYKLPKAGGNYF
jgi:hypothetical protein